MLGYTTSSMESVSISDGLGMNLRKAGSTTSKPFICATQRHSEDLIIKKQKAHPKNVDLPPILTKKKKKPFPVPIEKMRQAARKDTKIAEMGIEKPLQLPINGLLVPHLIPVAYEVLDAWKDLIKGLAQLVHVYGCSECSEVHVAHTGHNIQQGSR